MWSISNQNLAADSQQNPQHYIPLGLLVRAIITLCSTDSTNHVILQICFILYFQYYTASALRACFNSLLQMTEEAKTRVDEVWSNQSISLHGYRWLHRWLKNIFLSFGSITGFITLCRTRGSNWREGKTSPAKYSVKKPISNWKLFFK